MRCKNCGAENDDNRYICENCGSPLYDEEDFNDEPVGSEDTAEEEQAVNNGSQDGTDEDDKEKSPAEKKSIIVIAILVVVLIAVIASVIVVAHSKSSDDEETTISTTVSTTEEEESTTKSTTTKKTTTTTTTEATTTTTTTVQVQEWSVKVTSKGGGIVSGAGTYEDGENVTIVATPDDGYEFEGWYSNGTKISSTQSYSFTATENVSISAVFNPVETTEATESEDLDGGVE